MSKYGEVTVQAGDLLAKNPALAPREAWDHAGAVVFPNSLSSRQKSCPKAAFLTLCELGAFEAPAGVRYTSSESNRKYVIRAVAVLRFRPELRNDLATLWKIATEDSRIQHNSQLDVVMAAIR
jgi:hypothetical protein